MGTREQNEKDRLKDQQGPEIPIRFMRSAPNEKPNQNTQAYQESQELADPHLSCHQAVCPQFFNDKASCSIEQGIQKKEHAMFRNAPAETEEDQENQEIPAGLIEKRGQMPGDGSSFWNLYSKGKELKSRIVNRKTIGFHVEEIAPASDGLGKGNTWSKNIKEKSERKN